MGTVRSAGASAPQTAKSAAALRTFFAIARAWGLSTGQAMALLGLQSRSTYFKWKKAPHSARLSADTLERLSYIFGIYKALHILLPQPAAADGWLSRPNSAAPFNGRPALERMLSGQVADLFIVRQYLDAARGWS